MPQNALFSLKLKVFLFVVFCLMFENQAKTELIPLKYSPPMKFTTPITLQFRYEIQFSMI
jgi:hypothetical protein